MRIEQLQTLEIYLIAVEINFPPHFWKLVTA